MQGFTTRFGAAALLALAPLLAPAALAQGTPTDSFCTVISENDKQASDGFALTDAASILRQDRANYHRFGRADDGDGPDATFSTSKARERIPAMYAAGSTPSDVEEEIVYGAPSICVDVYGTRSLDVYFAGDAGDTGDAMGDAYPFEGRWDCEVSTFAFTAETYDNGSETLPILEIQEGSDGSYTLFFADDYIITLSGFTGEEMGWFSPASGDSFPCRRLG